MSLTHIGNLLSGKRALEALLSGITLERNGTLYRFDEQQEKINYLPKRDYTGTNDDWKPSIWKMNRFLEETFYTWCEYKAGDYVNIVDGSTKMIRKVERVSFDSKLNEYIIIANSPTGREVSWRSAEVVGKATEDELKEYEYLEKLTKIFASYKRELYEWKNGDIVIDTRDNKTYKVEHNEALVENCIAVTEFGKENAPQIYLAKGVLKPIYMIDDMII
ncbi:hypothetical protein [Bacillus phage YungSlug]|nr:hypothetical protein [Bacillus phage YungSlug]